jgi:hypothetical protein
VIRIKSEICSQDGEHIIGRGLHDREIFDCFEDAKPIAQKIVNEHDIESTFLRVVITESATQKTLGATFAIITSLKKKWSFIP